MLRCFLLVHVFIACSAGSSFDYGYDRYGGDLDSGIAATNENACAQLCEQNPTCRFWSWVRTNGLCYQKPSPIRPKSVSSTVVSGVKGSCNNSLVVLTAPVVISPNTAWNYLDQQTCMWRVSGASQLTVLDWSVSSGDTLTVYDGTSANSPSINKGSFATSAPADVITTTSGNFYLVWSTDLGPSNSTGWHILITNKAICPTGYTAQGMNGKCLDVDECATNSCGAQTCTNTLGSFACGSSACSLGYTANGTSGCKDINECDNYNQCISSTTMLSTISGYDYQWFLPPPRQTVNSFTFWAKGTNDIQFGLSIDGNPNSQTAPGYEIVFGGTAGTKSAARRYFQGTGVTTNTSNILSSTAYQAYWINFNASSTTATVSYGTGDRIGVNTKFPTIQPLVDNQPFFTTPGLIGICAWDKPGYYQNFSFCIRETIPTNTNYGASFGQTTLPASFVVLGYVAPALSGTIYGPTGDTVTYSTDYVNWLGIADTKSIVFTKGTGGDLTPFWNSAVGQWVYVTAGATVTVNFWVKFSAVTSQSATLGLYHQYPVKEMFTSWVNNSGTGWQARTILWTSSWTGFDFIYFTFGSIPSGRKVYLGGLQIFVNPYTNIALGKTATQSSQSGNGAASRAVDGNPDPTFTQNSCMSTNWENNPWWYVDLGRIMFVSHLSIINRGDCCAGQLSGVQFAVVPNITTVTLIDPYYYCQTAWTSLATGEQGRVQCNGNGRYVYVWIPGTNKQLTFCELQVLGHLAGCDPLSSCQNTVGDRVCAACPTGYYGYGDTGCRDLDECATIGACDPVVNCTNTVGSFICGNCPSGYTKWPPTGLCANDICFGDSKTPQNGGAGNCTNDSRKADGGFCVQTCNTGYTLASGNLTRICQNPPAYNNVTAFCDVNACTTSPCGAGVNATCIDYANADGSPQGRNCTCKQGFTGNGDTCTDVNACVSFPCGAGNNAVCVDLPPPNDNSTNGRTCTCKTGFTGNGDICTDINACLISPCAATGKSTCTDLPAPAGNTTSGRTCVCIDGFSGTGDICTDINECLGTPNPPCAVTRCLNSEGSFSCAPQIVSSSLVIHQGAESPLENNDTGFVVANVTGGSIIGFNITGGFNYTLTKVSYGGNPTVTSGCPSPQQALPLGFFTCQNFGLVNNNSTVKCRISAGYGSCLIFTINVCAARTSYDIGANLTCIDITGVDYFSYPHPILINGTIRLYQAGAQFAGPSLEIDSGNPSVHPLQVDGENLISDPTAMIVTYGPTNNFTAFNCSLQTDSTTPTLLVCSPQEVGATHNQLQIYVPSANWTFVTTDELTFPDVPKIQNITGCAPQGCPTRGILITVLGTDFDTQTKVYVGGVECINFDIVLSSTIDNITCSLPSGVGKNLPVGIATGGKQSISIITISYQPPSIAYLNSSACIQDIDGTLINCPRQGNALITITGDNFGESGALVLISGYECSTVTYLTLHQVLTCIIPVGINKQQPLSIVQGMQQDTSHMVISYAECLPGTYQVSQNPSNGTTCGNCTAGKYNPLNGSAFCSICPAGTFSGPNAVECQPCPNGTWSNISSVDGADNCSDCPMGTAREAGTLGCKECDIGFYSNQTGLTSCSNCPAGLYAPEIGATFCAPCTAGLYRRSKSLQACLDCKAGYFSGNASEDCELCPGGSYSASGSSYCDDCKAGWSRPSGSLDTCLVCQAGYYSGNGSLECELCGGGTYSVSGSSYCDNCVPGWARISGSTDPCAVCQPGKFANNSGTLTCTECPPGKEAALAGSINCTDCFPGTARVQGSSLGCQQCLPGFMANSSGKDSCDPCGEGTYSEDFGATTCDLCPQGKVRSFDAKSCQSCNDGEYTTINLDDSITTCSPCPDGTFSNSSNSTCLSCLPGFYSKQGSVTCTACAVGLYAPTTGMNECLPCGAGNWSNLSASICTPCSPGTFRTNQAGCESCQQGKYQNISGQTICIACEPGKSQIFSGQPNCTLCEIGKISQEYQSTRCIGCELQNGYTNYEGTTECHPCTGGLNCTAGIASPSEGFWALTTPKGVMNAVQCSVGCMNSTNCGLNRVDYDQNPLCGKCLPNYYEWGNNCVLCPQPNGGIIFLLILLTWVYVLVIHTLAQEQGSGATKVLLYFIAISHYLVSSKFYWLSWIWFLDFNLNDASGSICVAPLNPYQKLALQIFTPLIFFGELFITMIVHWYYLKFKSNQTIYLHNFVNRYIRSIFAILVFSYSMITSLCFRYLTCVDTGMNRVVFTMPAIDCNDPDYFRWRTLVILLVIFPVIGLPVSFALLLWKFRKTMKIYDPATKTLPPEATPLDAQVVARYGILFATYKPNRYYWEVWALLRRALILAFGNFLQPYAVLRTQILALLNVLILLLQLMYRPFQNEKEGNRAEAFSLTGLLLLCIFTTDMSTDIPNYVKIVVSMITLIWSILLAAIVIRALYRTIQNLIARRKGDGMTSSKTNIKADLDGAELQSLSNTTRSQLVTGGEEEISTAVPVTPSHTFHFDEQRDIGDGGSPTGSPNTA